MTLILVQSPTTDDPGALLAKATYTHSKDFTALLATTCRTVSHSCIIVKHLCSCKLTQSFINHTSSLLTNSPLPLAQANAISPHAGVITTAQCHNSPTLDYMVSQLPPFFSISPRLCLRMLLMPSQCMMVAGSPCRMALRTKLRPSRTLFNPGIYSITSHCSSASFVIPAAVHCVHLASYIIVNHIMIGRSASPPNFINIHNTFSAT